jgi:hypothetical protein
MVTIKKAQGGSLIKKGIKAASEAAPKVSKWDYPTQKSRDFQREFIKAYPEKIKKLPTGTNKIDKVKKVKPSYDKNGLEILKDKNGGAVKKVMKTGGSIPKAQVGRLIKKGVKAVSNEVNAIKSGVKQGVKQYKTEKFFNKLRDPNSPIPKMPKGAHFKSGGKMKNGGSLSGLTASTKRDKGTDVDGAFTKVQKKTLAGAKGKASLTKDKQLGATKMKMGGKMKKC